MKKLILNLGKALSKAEQKVISGGLREGGSRKPELCEVVDGVIYVCYAPLHCSSVFPYTCIQ